MKRRASGKQVSNSKQEDWGDLFAETWCSPKYPFIVKIIKKLIREILRRKSRGFYQLIYFIFNKLCCEEKYEIIPAPAASAP
jgi:hypothetical protein